MMSNWLRALQRALHSILAPALAVVVAGALVGCGGGGYLPSPLSVTDPRPLPADFQTRKAVSYSPYREATSEANLNDEVFEDAEILQDLQLIRAADIGVIRLFSSRAFGDQVLRIIRTNAIDLKVMLGAYPNPVYDDAAEADNQAELDEAIRLANVYSDIVQAVSVGNETMVSWSTHKIDPKVMGRYILKVRQAILQPVTTDDNWAFWASAPKAITDVVDFAAVHTYPLLDTFYDRALWEWRAREASPETRAVAMADAAIAEAKRQFGESRAFLDRLGLKHLPMVIGETGWLATDYDGGPVLPYRVHAVNQKLYYDRLQQWAADGRAAGNGPQTVFYFQAFDERWKGGDDGWGLFTRDRKARCVVQTLNAPSGSWVYDASQSCAAEAAVYFVEAVVNDPQPADVTRYTLFSDAAAVAGEVRATGQQWDAFGKPTGGVTADYPVVGGSTSGDGSQFIDITPQPADYGWGLLLHPSDPAATANLTGFTSLTFWIKTNGYGKLEIALFSDTDDRSGAQAFLVLEPGQYGYADDNAWHQVTIPIAAFLAVNPLLDVQLINAGFVISDRFEFTGKPLGTTGLPKIGVDGIAWNR